MCITFPIGMGLTPYLFNGTEMATQGSSYFRVLMYGNFLFPLGAGFSAYFIGLGRTKIIGIATLGSQLINIGLNYVLIFGVVGIIPSLGVKGAAFATLFSQAIFCLSLFVLFFWERRAKEYGIRNWTFNKTLFKETLSLGMPKSLSKISVLIAWSAAVRLVSHLEGDYLLVFARPTYSYQTEMIFWSTATESVTQKAHGLLNGTAGFTLPRYKLSFTIFGTNLLEEKYIEVSDSKFMSSLQIPGAPRMFGTKLSWQF